MNNTPKKARIAQNAIFVSAGAPESGLLVISDIASATNFRDRFRTGTYTVPADSDLIPELKTYNGVTANEDGSVVRPEVFPSQGNGYDSYANGIGGFMRSDVPYNFTPQALGKMALIAIDALHEKALSDNEAEANDAKSVLSALRGFDGVAEQQNIERLAARKRETAIAALVATGMPLARAEAILAEPTAAPVPVATVEPSETAPRKGKGKREPASEAVPA